MSYDLYLRDPVTKKELQVPAHMMYGGNFRCDVVGGQLVPTTTTEAYLNITYNYGRYYYEAFPDDKDHAGHSMKMTAGGSALIRHGAGFTC